jgi:hypothetical protein
VKEQAEPGTQGRLPQTVNVVEIKQVVAPVDPFHPVVTDDYRGNYAESALIATIGRLFR